MLTVEDRFMIKDLYRRGVSLTEIARRTGHDRKTVRRLLAAPLVPVPTPRTPRSTKLDRFVPYLEQRLAEGVLNARKLYGELLPRGYSGCETTVRAWLACRRPPRSAPATVRFETAPGEQAQCDWGHFGTIQHAGVQRYLYAFLMTLGYSRVLYLEFTISVDTAWWLRCHQHAFAYFGGVPRTVLHDNLKSAVLDRDAAGVVHWNARYLDFANHWGFTPRACAPYRPQTKGKIENGVGYVRRNFWPGLRFRDLADLNAQAHTWLDSVANQRVHGTTGVVPFSRLAAEELAPLRLTPYDTAIIVARRSTRDCLVSYDGNLYSVPAAQAGQHLLLKATETGDLLINTLTGLEVARHRLGAGHGQRVVVAAHTAGLPAKRQPTRRGQALQLPTAPGELPPAPVVEVRSLQVYEAYGEGVA